MWLTIGIERSLGSINASAERETKGCGVASAFNLPLLEFGIVAQFSVPFYRGARHRRCMTQIDLNGQRAVVTGGARGIGFAIARRLIDSGARVSLWDRDTAALEEAAQSLNAGDAVHLQTVNLIDPADVDRAATSTEEALGGLQIVVNNAGIAGVNRKTWELSIEEWRSVVEIDLNAALLDRYVRHPRPLHLGPPRPWDRDLAGIEP